MPQNIPDSQADSPFNRFSDRARKAMKNAWQQARDLHHDYIGTEHLLLGLLTDGDGIAICILESHKVDIAKLRESLLAQLSPGVSKTEKRLPFTPRVKAVLLAAVQDEHALKADYIGTEHLLVALLSDTETVAGRLLSSALNADANSIRNEIDPLIQSLQPELQAGERTKISDDPLLQNLHRSTSMDPIPNESMLCPRQTRSFQQLLDALPNSNIFVLWGATGLGKTTILRALHEKTGGAIIDIRNFLDAMRGQHPLAIEETLQQLILEQLATNSYVYVDDIELIERVASNCQSYPRSGFILAAMSRVAVYAVEHNKRLIIANDSSDAQAIRQRAYYVKIGEFQIEDYSYFCKQKLKSEVAETLDYKKIYRFAPKLNAYQLMHTCEWTRHWTHLNTDGMIEYLRSQRMTSNVDLGEVRAVELHELKGVDDVIRSLEANIILPLENDKLAEELNLRPKRGVLLAGPPGTGKTTVGRALAHRLRSKFFLIDGTFIAGTSQFYNRVSHVFESAKQNAPSIIFIDDSDVIFENGEEAGLYRYLLTMLDGLESESAGRVCVILTAMDVAHLPPALIRSGRIELWLEMRLPDVRARAEILEQICKQLPPTIGVIDIQRAAAATESFTGADLTRLIEDTKTLFAYDKSKNLTLKAPTDYLLAAVDLVRGNKKLYERAEARTRQQRPNRPPWFDVMSTMPMNAAQENAPSED